MRVLRKPIACQAVQWKGNNLDEMPTGSTSLFGAVLVLPIDDISRRHVNVPKDFWVITSPTGKYSAVSTCALTGRYDVDLVELVHALGRPLEEFETPGPDHAMRDMAVA